MDKHFVIRKKPDRFNGKSEAEVLSMKLPDRLKTDLDIIIIGINPGLTAAFIGHHYAGPGNHFWKCLYMSGLISEPMNAYDDERAAEYGIGFTNIVARPSKGSSDLSRKEIKDGAETLMAKIQKFKPKIAVFNGKGIYEIFVGHKNFVIGKQPEPFPGTKTVIFVMPSSSARCSQLPRAIDKLPFYIALKKLRDHLKGDLPDVDESELIFPDLELKIEAKKDKTLVPKVIKRRTYNMEKRALKSKMRLMEQVISDGESNDSSYDSEDNIEMKIIQTIQEELKAEHEKYLEGRSNCQSSAHWMYDVDGLSSVASSSSTDLIKQEKYHIDYFNDNEMLPLQAPTAAAVDLKQFIYKKTDVKFPIVMDTFDPSPASYLVKIEPEEEEYENRVLIEHNDFEERQCFIELK